MPICKVELSYDEASWSQEVVLRAVVQEKTLGPRPSTAGGGRLRVFCATEKRSGEEIAHWTL